MRRTADALKVRKNRPHVLAAADPGIAPVFREKSLLPDIHPCASPQML
jgi:hypothetical protein